MEGERKEAKRGTKLTGQVDAGNTVEEMVANETAYFREATRLRHKYARQIQILIGFECDWIRPESLTLIQESLERVPFEFFIGSVHHTHTIPIDYDRALYEKARTKAGGSDEKLFADYFDSQFDMLQKLKPPVVGHFDLIRLKSDQPDASFSQYPDVWAKILRNLKLVAEYGGLLELNSAALRKGMAEPYPQGEICREFLKMGGRFCLSDDSHGADQVGLNFKRVMEFVQRVGIRELYYLQLADRNDADSAPDARFPNTRIRSMPVEEVKGMRFFEV